MTEFVLVRHGETDWNVESRLQGTTDVPLNARGLEQAKQAAEELRNTVWDVILSSPLQRAYETAVIITRELGVGESVIETNPELRERCYGLAEGLNIPERIERFPDNIWPESETLEDMDERTGAVMHQLAETHAGKRMLLVAHGGWIRAALRVTSGYRPDVMELNLANASRSYVSHDGERWIVGEIGVTDLNLV